MKKRYVIDENVIKEYGIPLEKLTGRVFDCVIAEELVEFLKENDEIEKAEFLEKNLDKIIDEYWNTDDVAFTEALGFVNYKYSKQSK
jgi:hypothetical protein